MSNIYKIDDQESLKLSSNNSLPTHIFRPTPFPTSKPFTFKTYSFDQFTFPPHHFDSYTFPPIKFEPPPNKHLNRSERSVVVFIVVVIIYVIWEVLTKSVCKKEEEDDTEAIYSSNNIQQMPSSSLPVASVISENSRNFTRNAGGDQPSTPSAPPVEYQQPQVFQPTAPPFIEQKVPNYDSPPNYEEAMTMLSQQKQEHGSSILNDFKTNRTERNSHQPQDTHL